MKKNLVLFFVAMFAVCGATMAQKTIKLGHINSTELMQIMPGRDSAQAILQAEVTELENTLKAMQAEVEQRYNEYMQKEGQWSDLIKQTKQKEIQDMTTRVEEFKQNAQQSLQTREQELLQPIIDRAKKAIEDVSQENNFTYIFDAGIGVLLYEGGENIMPLVKKKLGLK